MPGSLRAAAAAAVVLVCLAAAPADRAAVPDVAVDDLPADGRPLPTSAEFAELLRTDPLRGLEAALARAKADVRGFTAVMHKQERIGKVLGPQEVVRVACRTEPFAVRMTWEQGATKLRSPVDTLYAAGENHGRTRAKLRLGLTLDVPIDGADARAAARYAIDDFGFYPTTLRGHRAWAAAKAAGKLRTEFLGTRPVPECGGRVCHVVKRHCDPADIDNFRMADTHPRDPAKFPDEAFATVTLMFDADTWLQLGAELRRADGGLTGAYYFREVVVNPAFPPGTFVWK